MQKTTRDIANFLNIDLDVAMEVQFRLWAKSFNRAESTEEQFEKEVTKCYSKLVWQNYSKKLELN